MFAKKALAASVSTEPVFVESVFSTYLYTGNGSTQTITNNIDLAGYGGLVWIKNRVDGARHHELFDTARGVYKALYSNQTWAQGNDTNDLTAFNNNGFSIGSVPDINGSGNAIASWTFRKQAKFFDVVTYTGNGTAGRTVSHSLGSVPGCIIVKRTDAANGWAVYHRSMNASPQDYMMRLNATDAAFTTSPSRWNNTLPTSTVFTLSGNDEVNGSGGTYVAYLFAHDAGGFGTSGSDNVISCGSVVIGSGGQASVTLGYEPQWILYKTTTTAQEWYVYDVMRGMPVGTASGPYSRYLNPNSSAAEGDGASFALTPTGFDIKTSIANATYIYIAIRRGPMKTPTSGTSVFSPNAVTSSSGNTTVTAGFPVDLSILKLRDFADGARWIDRLRGITSSTTPEINSTSTSAEFTSTDIINAGQTTVQIGPIGTYSCVNWNFRRAPGFFDVVCYTGTGSATTFSHNLGVVPEMMIVKGRNNTLNWVVYHKNMPTPETAIIYLNDTSAKLTDSGTWNATNPTSTVFSVGTAQTVNQNTISFVAYLFATVAGVSKVGSYTGTGTTIQVDCGFTAGARFVLIKRSNSTGGDWYVWDSARGIVAGNDPYLLLNSTAAETTGTDYIDTYTAGFEISSTAPAAINANGGTYIFLAIA